MPAATGNPIGLRGVDQFLSNIARAYKPHGFAGPRVAPTIPVERDSDLYPIFDGFFDDEVDNKVADRAETPRVDFSWSTDTYLCEDYRLAADLTEKEERNAHNVLHLRQNKLDSVLLRMAIRRERRIADVLQQVGTGGGQLTGGSATPSVKWDAGTVGTPATIEKDIKTGILAVYNATGTRPNTLVVDFAVGYAIALDPSIREIIKYISTGSSVQLLELGDQVLPSKLHGLNVIVVEGAMRNTAREGATRSLTGVWGKDARLLYLPEGGGGYGIPSTAYTFQSKPQMVDRWKDNDPPVEVVRAWETVDEKVCAPATGYSLLATIA